MKRTDKQQENINKITKFLLINDVVHYQDIIDYMNLSRKTVAKYLDMVEQDLPADVDLVRKRNQGIFLKGDKEKLIQKFGLTGSSNKVDVEPIDMLEILLNETEPILLDDLADKLFISKSTLERRIQDLKDNFGLEIQSTANGIFVDENSPSARKSVSQIIKKYWSPTITQDENKRFRYSFELPRSLKKYVSQDILDKVQECIFEFGSKNNVDINEFEYESLLIHITVAVQRILNKEEIKPIQADQNLKIDNLTINLAKLIEQNFDCKLPDSEIAYLNIHILAIKKGYLDQDTVETNGLQNDPLVEFLKASLLQYDDTLLKNLTVHLRPAIHRSELGITIKNPYKEKIKKSFPYSMDLATQLATKVDKQYNVRLNDDEICYIALHFELFSERNKSKTNKVQVAVVCSTGYGSAALIKQQLLDKLSNHIEVVQTMSVQELLANGVKADIIITTIPINLKEGNEKVLRVSPLLTDMDLDLIKKTVDKVRTNNYIEKIFLTLLDKTTILIDSKVSSPEEAIKRITEVMHQGGYVDSSMTEAALQRERLSATSLGNIAIPHGDIKHVVKPNLGILISKKGINWNKDKVHLVFFIAFNQQVKENMDQIYSYLYDLIQDKKKIQELVKAETPDKVVKIITD